MIKELMISKDVSQQKFNDITLKIDKIYDTSATKESLELVNEQLRILSCVGEERAKQAHNDFKDL